ncbi:MAG: hypothetical protein LBE50_03085 [Gallionellaceae bacterium]|jgi:hypothetical protein|nr:hypothetical protein [Gallionellaceae bacterium]
MKVALHTARQYADVMREDKLLPPGKAWDWRKDGFGDTMLVGTGEELARLEIDAKVVLDAAVDAHRPAISSWHINEYRRVANEAAGGIAGVQVDHLLGPFRVGSHAGDGLWGHRSRYIMRVRYNGLIVNAVALWEALAAFKQSHVYLWFEDTTGTGGFYAPN